MIVNGCVAIVRQYTDSHYNICDIARWLFVNNCKYNQYEKAKTYVKPLN